MSKIMMMVVGILLLVLATSVYAGAKDTLKISYNNKEFKCDYKLQDGRVFVPLRILSEHINYKVEWDGEDKTIGVSNNRDFIQLQIGSKCIWVYNGDTIFMDTVPIFEKGRVYVPIRFIAEALNKKVKNKKVNSILMVEIYDK